MVANDDPFRFDPKHPLLNQANRLKRDADAKAKAKAEAEAAARRWTPPTRDEIEAWRLWRSSEPEHQRQVRERTISRFEREAGFGYRLGGELVPALECAARLRLGAPLEPFISAEGRGGIWMGPRRGWSA